MDYGEFSRFYDSLTENADYEKRADYYETILRKNGINGGILLDLGCGTGSMSIPMSKKGYSVIGVDLSVDMLMSAREKAFEAGENILFLNQDMTELDLYGTINAAISVLDCINHLDSEKSIAKAFAKVSLFTEPGGIFVFDVNTVYKHNIILGNNTFIIENEKVFCSWQNTLKNDNIVEIILDFFEKQGEMYKRSGETFTEKAYPLETIKNLLEESGFEVLNIYDDMTENPVRENSEKAVFVARKR